MSKPKIACVVGTRPDLIKTAPVILELQKYAELVETVLVATGQHREMLDQALAAFGLKSNHDLNIMTPCQSLSEVTTRALSGLDCYLEKEKPDFVMAQGDTTTTFVTALACYYRRIPFGHIEAGLRTDTIWFPYPEEFNRRSVAMLAAQHYAPTLWAAEHLKQERIPKESIFITGNTGIDAVQQIADKAPQKWFQNTSQKMMLLTTHRRENWGAPQQNVAEAMLVLLDRFLDYDLVVSVHPNPKVKELLHKYFEGNPRAHLIDPPPYQDFIKLMQRCRLIFTDSGGIQEEAPTLGVPVLVLRECTERPEGIQAGTAVLVGASTEKIIDEASKLLKDPQAYERMAQVISPYGDGVAAKRIRYLSLNYLNVSSPKESMWISSKPSY